MRRLGTAGLGVLVAAAGLFLLLPIVAVFVAAGPREIAEALGRDAVIDALRVTVTTNLVAQGIVLAVGTPLAYLVARGVPLRALVVALIELPLVLPPAVAGLGLLYTFGRQGILGGVLDDAGVAIALTRTAVVLAVAYVSSPFYLRAAIAAFEGVDRGLLEAARTLGAGPVRVFARVAVPLALHGLTAGAALAFARGLGEFGATIVFAGSLPGVTETLPLAVYAELDREPSSALAIGAVLIVVSVVILSVTKIGGRWRR